MGRGCVSCTVSLFLSSLLFSIFLGLFLVNAEEKKNYIVYMGDLPQHSTNVVDTHHALLKSVVGSHAAAKEARVHSYRHSFNAFAAKLTEEQAHMLSEMDDVVFVIPSRKYRLHTSRSWDFLGFPIDVKRIPQVESDVIIGVIDTGINPDSESFNDEGFGPPPAKWKGSCGPFPSKFSGCNNKLIGAKYFRVEPDLDTSIEFESPIDAVGHGTHIASTVAGRVIHGASLNGIGEGTIRGGVPGARIAAYKACWMDIDCGSENILAAFDAAIADGVDIIQLSSGDTEPQSDFSDEIEIGSYHAMRKGILTVASAGNSGVFSMAAIANTAPWIFTVGSSNIDRAFRTKITLGDGKEFYGFSINTFDPNGTSFPLTSSFDARLPKLAEQGGMDTCTEEILDPEKVKGKIVTCTYAMDVENVFLKWGAGGMLFDGDDDVSPLTMIPGATVGASQREVVSLYMNTTQLPVAMISKSEAYDLKNSTPVVSSFSSRGPSIRYKYMLKPDIVAPGNQIMAAWTPLVGPTEDNDDKRVVKYNVETGTSMSSPHVSAIAAYIKSFHPTWSPAAIKSAIMTSATPMSSLGKNWDFGSGNLNPLKALDPGLVYEAIEMDYFQYLCNVGFDKNLVNKLENLTCPMIKQDVVGVDAINYPSMTLTLPNKDSNTPSSGVFVRTVTNYGLGPAVYKATVSAEPGLTITVEPITLSFSGPMEKQSFKVKVTAEPLKENTIMSGSLVWSDSVHEVRSPVVVERYSGEPFNLDGKPVLMSSEGN